MLTGVTNSLAVAHKGWMARCSPHAPGFLAETINIVIKLSNESSKKAV